MYLYQKIRRKQERKIKVVFTLCFVCILFLAVECSKNGNQFRQEIEKCFYREITAYCIPLLEYQNSSDEPKGLADYLAAYFFPVLSKQKERIYYQTEIESEFSYEMVLAMEAAAENYVDMVTGEVVGDTDMEELIPDDGMLEKNLVPKEELAAEEETITKAAPQELLESTAAAATFGKEEKQVTYSREKLADFDYLIQNFYRVDKTTTINSEQLNAEEMLKEDMTLTQGTESPQILIYHTHSQEGYVDSIAGDSTTTVVGVGEYLTQLLQEKYGLSVLHHTGEYDVETRDDAYSRAGPAVEKILAENPGIEVVIDLHRDGVGENTHLVTTQDGVEMAKIMFVNGLSRTTKLGEIGYLYNPNLADNLTFSFQTQLAAAEYYPGLSRGVYLKGYRFNLHYCPKSLLVEVGAQTNTVQEAMNAMVPLADILNKVLTGTE